jgi:hypothetical protein
MPVTPTTIPNTVASTIHSASLPRNSAWPSRKIAVFRAIARYTDPLDEGDAITSLRSVEGKR